MGPLKHGSSVCGWRLTYCVVAGGAAVRSDTELRRKAAEREDSGTGSTPQGQIH